jgi:CspA family cold shock protein
VKIGESLSHSWLHMRNSAYDTSSKSCCIGQVTLFNFFGDQMMETGTAKRFNDARRFSCIAPDGGGEDPFAHLSEALSEAQGSGFKSLRKNQKVGFNVKPDPKDKQAANIQPFGEHA